jgi:hypothetical protein
LTARERQTDPRTHGEAKEQENTWKHGKILLMPYALRGMKGPEEEEEEEEEEQIV